MCFRASKILGVAEETGHVDEHVLIQGFDFRRVGLQVFDIVGKFFNFMDQHAPLDSPQDRGFPVVGKVDASGSPQKLKERVDTIAVRLRKSGSRSGERDGET